VETPETRYAKTVDGVHIAYQVVGDGPVDLLWLDGMRGNLEVMWEQPLVSGFFSKLAARCRVIRLDLRGTGLSDRGERAPNLETQMEDARTVLDAVASHRTAIAGHGRGCSAACLFASTFPGRVTALILISASARNRWSAAYPWGFTEDVLLRQLRVLEDGWGTPAYAAMELSSSAPSMVDDREYVAWVAKVQRHWIGPNAAAALEQQFWESDVAEVMRSVQTPTLVIAREWEGGEEDEYVVDLFPNARLARLPGADWMIWVSEQEPVIAEIHGFLEAEPSAEPTESVLATVLFTDVVGSTEHQASLGDRSWKELVERHHAVVRDALARWRGIENDTAGDGFYATFDGPARAIRCALDVSERVRELGLEIRAGLHTGECELIDGKVGGIAVATGSRIASLAGPSEVLISQTVKDLVAGSGLSFEDAGEHELKGIPDRWRLYRVVA
jgi:class 3 adenylate cyclase/alpha-beta hydrolase superfamily lysophospholipase